MRFIFTRGEPGVYAWDLPEPLNPAAVDVERYTRLTLRAAHAILQPLGVDEDVLENWIIRNASYVAPPGVLTSRRARKSPLWTNPLVPEKVDEKYFYSVNMSEVFTTRNPPPASIDQRQSYALLPAEQAT